jgi:hypothetical protein
LRPKKHEGVKCAPYYKTPFVESSLDPSKHQDPQQNYITTKKDWQKNDKIFGGGQSEERDEFYFGKRTFRQKRELYKSGFTIQ